MTISFDLSPELERRLQEEAARYGLAPADFVRTAVEEKLATADQPASAVDENPLYAGLPRRDPRELIDLARQQGAQIPLRFDDLKGDFWPEEESADEFLATLREWRQEGIPERHETSTE